MWKRFGVAVLAMLALTLVGHAQDSDPASLEIATDADLGTYLVDGDGRSLYVFASDEGGEGSTCYEACAEAWPPFTVTSAEAIEAGDGVAASLVSGIQRDDGAIQVAYNGMPLYYFASDESPGDTGGHGVNDAWFLYSPYGVAIEVASEAEEEAAGEGAAPRSVDEIMGGGAAQAERVEPERMEAGRVLFQEHCASCHGLSGNGDSGPALDGNEALSNTGYVVRQIRRGSQYMPAFEEVLDDEQIATIATFVRNAWSNQFGPVTPEEVGGIR